MPGLTVRSVLAAMAVVPALEAPALRAQQQVQVVVTAVPNPVPAGSCSGIWVEARDQSNQRIYQLANGTALNSHSYDYSQPNTADFVWKNDDPAYGYLCARPTAGAVTTVVSATIHGTGYSGSTVLAVQPAVGASGAVASAAAPAGPGGYQQPTQPATTPQPSGAAAGYGAPAPGGAAPAGYGQQPPAGTTAGGYAQQPGGAAPGASGQAAAGGAAAGYAQQPTGGAAPAGYAQQPTGGAAPSGYAQPPSGGAAPAGYAQQPPAVGQPGYGQQPGTPAAPSPYAQAQPPANGAAAPGQPYVPPSAAPAGYGPTAPNAGAVAAATPAPAAAKPAEKGVGGFFKKFGKHLKEKAGEVTSQTAENLASSANQVVDATAQSGSSLVSGATAGVTSAAQSTVGGVGTSLLPSALRGGANADNLPMAIASGKAELRMMRFVGTTDVLDPNGRNLAKRLAAVLKTTPGKFLIQVHMDPLPSPAEAGATQQLSERRAARVKQTLIDEGVEEARLRALGYGTSSPKPEVPPEGGPPSSARVEIWKLE